MAGMKWTNEWVRDAEESNRELLLLTAMRHTVRNSVSQRRSSWRCFAPRSTSVP